MRLSNPLSWTATAVAVTICLLFGSTDASSKSRNPLNYISLLEAPRISTPSHRLNAFSHFDLTFDLHQHTQKIKLSLEPNHDIIHEDAHITFLDKEGNPRHSEKLDRDALKVYQGSAYTVQDDGSSLHVGWARIFVKKDGQSPLFEGAFTVMGDHHHIYTKSSFMATKHVKDPHLEDSDEEYMVVWRDTDVSRLPSPLHSELKREAGLTCGSDALDFNTNPDHALYRGLIKRTDDSWGSMSISNILGKRQNIDSGQGGGNSAGVNLRSTIGSTAGCPTTRKVALIGIATDCGYTASFSTTDALRENIITQVNTASDLYQSTFNITLGLRNLTVSDAECPGTASPQTPWNIGCSGSTTITDRLNTFSQWRGQRGDNNAYWSLWTTCNTGAEVGLAWLGQLCNTGSTDQGGSQTVTGANVVARTSTEWQVFAHETGHTFGAVHDCDSSTCQDSNTVNSGQCCPVSASGCDAQAQYLMNPYSSPGITQFSPCSVGNICSALGRNSVTSTCLSDNRGVTTITGNQCGNGIVEDGEDCDCGGAEGCSGNVCCNPSTCKFNTGATCDPSNEGCCTTECQFSAAGTVCRASTGQCDPQETCSGTNATCPFDQTAEDGTSCGTGLQCASGQCTSRDLQCKTLMGSYTAGNDTYACNSQTCSLSCASPDFGANVCYSMQQNFLDGTPCSGGGHCENGVCRGSSVGGEVKSWIKDNKTLVIALASAIGGILVLGILACCIKACLRPKGKKMAGVPGAGRSRRRARGDPQPHYGWDGPGVPQEMRDRGYGGSWQPPPPPPGPVQQTSWGHPTSPAPVYGGYPGGGRTVRYA
jgi:Metallo-peptidase family M12/Disintegrin